MKASRRRPHKMVDNPGAGASSLLNTPADAFPVTTREAHEQAYAIVRRARYDSDYRSKLQSGDAAALAEVKAATEIANSPTSLIINGVSVKLPGGEQPEARAREIGGLLKYISIGPDAVKHLQENRPVPAWEKVWAENTIRQLRADDAWVRRHNAGGRAEMSQLAHLKFILRMPTETK
jgi:hypothetical protein